MAGDETFVLFTFAWCCSCFQLLIQASSLFFNVAPPVHCRCATPLWSRACLCNGYRAVIGCDCCSPSNPLRAETTQIDQVRKKQQGWDFNFLSSFWKKNATQNRCEKREATQIIWTCLHKRWNQLPQKGDRKWFIVLSFCVLHMWNLLMFSVDVLLRRVFGMMQRYHCSFIPYLSTRNSALMYQILFTSWNTVVQRRHFSVIAG